MKKLLFILSVLASWPAWASDFTSQYKAALQWESDNALAHAELDANLDACLGKANVQSCVQSAQQRFRDMETGAAIFYCTALGPQQAAQDGTGLCRQRK